MNNAENKANPPQGNAKENTQNQSGGSGPRDSSGSRWWEAYLTRYLIGSIVGALCVYYLLINAGCNGPLSWLRNFVFNSSGGGCNEKTVGLAVESNELIKLGIMGFAFCYLASAPLTLLHYLRKALWFKRCRFKCCCGKNAKENNDNQSEPECSAHLSNRHFAWFQLVFWLPAFALLINCAYVQFIALAFIAAGGIVFASFRVKCASLKAVKDSIMLNKDFKNENIEKSTYKHLAEHGNAYSIVILEVIITAAIYRSNCYIYDWSLIAAAILWVMPGAFCWYLAKTIERHAIAHYEKLNSASTHPKS